MDNAYVSRKDSGSSSPLSELSRSPSPPPSLRPKSDTQKTNGQIFRDVPVRTSRRLTGITSKHFSPSKKRANRNATKHDLTNADLSDSNSSFDAAPEDDDYYYNASKKGKRKGRVPAGVSNHLFPPISAPMFGIIQEKLWTEPFWLLIAVTFLNKTAGRAAAPIFWELRRRYPTSEQLAEADEQDLHDLVYHLGLQTQRSRRLIKIAQAWTAQQPEAGKRYRTLHYPVKGDGKTLKEGEALNEDAEACAGALEIGHIPGCGPYAWDSWRIFCRDTLRGVATDFTGGNAISDDFVPEWKRVLPLDKELRACLRWFWLRDGHVWNHETGATRKVTEEEWTAAVRGELEPVDEDEARFTARAKADMSSQNDANVSEIEHRKKKQRRRSEKR